MGGMIYSTGRGEVGAGGDVGECELEYRAQSFNGVSQQCRCKADVITIRNHSAETGTVPHKTISNIPSWRYVARFRPHACRSRSTINSASPEDAVAVEAVLEHIYTGGLPTSADTLQVISSCL